MISTTPKPGDRLRKHADDLRSGRLTWVPHYPERDGECCALVSMVGYATHVVVSVFAGEYEALGKVTGQPGLVGHWSDEQTSKEPVISALEAAADLLDKEGE